MPEWTPRLEANVLLDFEGELRDLAAYEKYGGYAQLKRALDGMDAETLIAERLSGQSPFMTTDLFLDSNEFSGSTPDESSKPAAVASVNEGLAQIDRLGTNLLRVAPGHTPRPWGPTPPPGGAGARGRGAPPCRSAVPST